MTASAIAEEASSWFTAAACWWAAWAGPLGCWASGP